MNDVMAAAIVAANGKLRNLPKTSTAKIETKSGGTFSYNYAPLPDLLDVVRPVLAEHGLALLQHVSGTGGQVGVHTLLVHESGSTYVAGYVTLPATDPKVAGSVITYLRRYAICALFGIAGDDDLDSSPAAGPAVSVRAGGTPNTVLVTPTEGVASTAPRSGQAGASFPVSPEVCDHHDNRGNWVQWKVVPFVEMVDNVATSAGNREVCPKCGTPKLIAMESGGPYP